MLTIRVAAFCLAALLLAKLIDPTSGFYLGLWFLCLLTFWDLLSLVAGGTAFFLAVGLFHHSDAWNAVLVIFTGVSVLRNLVHRRDENFVAVTGNVRRWRRERWRG